MKNLFHKGLCLVMALCCIAFKGYAGGGTLPAAQGHDLKLSYSRTTLNTVADAITQQVGIVFSYEIALADYPMENLYVTEQGAALDAILKTVFTPRGIDYRVVDKVAVLTRSAHPAQTVKAAPAKAQVTGVVRDAAGNPMIGVTVTVKGTLVGVSTGVDGSYTIPADKDAMLLFSYIGYRNQEELVGQRTQIDVTMQEDQLMMDEVVVVGYGTLKKRNIVGAVENLAGDAVENRPNADITRSLQGQIPGLNIVQTDGKAAHGGQVTIRGVNNSFKARVNDGQKENKLGQGGSALVLFDGAVGDLCSVNPDDIASISLLKGASAAARYGAGAAIGAIMITTKKGKAGALKVTLSSNTEFLDPFVQPEFQNRYGTGSNGVRSGSGIYSWGQKLLPAARYGYTPADFFDTGHVYTNAVTVSGGTDKNQTYFSAASVNSDGIIPNNEYDRYNFTFRNTSYFLKDKLRLDASASYIYQKDQNMTNQGVYSNPLVPAYLFPRGENFAIYKKFERYNPGTKLMEQFWSADMEGGDLRMQNPYWIAYRNLRNTDKKRYMLSFSASYDILPWLSVSGRVRLDNSNSLYTQKLYASSNTTITDGGKNGHYTEARAYDTQTNADVMLNVNKTFGDDWSLTANVGASLNNIKTDELSYRGPIQENGLPNIFNVFDLDDTKKRAEKVGWHDQTQSVFASVEVGWKQMLYLTATGRNDWASQIAGSPSKSFFYPSVGLSWVPSSTWDLGNAFSYLKLRGSIASVGLPFPRFLTTPTYEYDATGKIWKDKTHYPIGDLKPERTITYEVGIDARLWKNISLSASWYSADTKNQTFDPALPPSSSYTTIYLQTGHVRNTGVELSLGYSNQWRDFGWSSNFTFSWNKNEIIDLASGALNPVTGQPLNLSELDIKGLGKAKYILKQGGTLGDLYTTSDLKFNDNGYVEVDKAGNLLLTDEGDQIYLGSVFPSENLAWRNDFRYKGINLGLLFTGRIGGICYSATQANMDLYGVSEVSAAARDAGGVLINGREMVDAQKWYQAIGSQSGLPQYYTYSATNFRLQELSLGYTLPRKWFRNKMGLTVSFVGRNLWMIYCKAPFDPEAVASTGLSYQGIDYFMMPSLRSLGFNVKFEF